MAPPAVRRVLVVTAGMGAGHAAAARELASRLERRGTAVRVVDLLALPGQRGGAWPRVAYALLLRCLPQGYDAVMRAWARWPETFARFTAVGGGGYERGLSAEVARFRPDRVVSTYNLASQVLGRLALRGEITAPVSTYVTDPGAHPYWVHPGVRQHLAVTAPTAAALTGLGARGVVLTRPLLAPGFATPADRDVSRRQVGLPPGVRVALVSGGSWAAGQVERAVRLLAADPALLPVTLCGRDERLRRRLERAGLGRPLGWRDDVPALLAAADVLVDNAGGLTCLEALAVGLPVVLFRVLPGHGRLNAATLAGAGFATWARRDETLLPAVRRPRAGPRDPFAGADPADVVLAP